MLAFTESQFNPYRKYCFPVFVIAVAGAIWYCYSILQESSQPYNSKFGLLPLVFYFITTCCFIYSILFQQLKIRIDEAGIHFRTPFSWTVWRSVLWSEVSKVYIREYAPQGEYPKGILGRREGPNGVVYDRLPGLHPMGLQIEKTNGGRILIGTKRPDDLREYLLNHVPKDRVYSER
jgi:hypothetical protein